MPTPAGPGNQYAAMSRGLLWYKQFLQRASTLDVTQSGAVGYNAQYVGSTKWTAVAAWAVTTAYTVGQLVRQNAVPSVGSERVFLCIQAGTSGGSEPTWNLTMGSITTDSTVVWKEVTGKSAYGWSAPHARLANAVTTPWY